MTKYNGHIYTVELRFTDENLDPSEVSRRLGLIPTSSLSFGDNKTTLRKRRPRWGYNGKGEIGFQAEWTSLEEGLGFLFKILGSKKYEIASIARQFNGVWWCGHFQTSFNGGPILSSKLLTEICGYGLPLRIDNYFGEE